MKRVALESTVISHGLPYPDNLELGREMERIIRSRGAVPATVGVIGGELIAGLSPQQIERLATASGVRKVSRRDLPIVVARKLDGATTVAATMWIAHRAGIELFATGGIGGVHRMARREKRGERKPHSALRTPRFSQFDVSADLQELAQTPVIVVCAGAKSILDLPATLEYLETHGVTVIGYGTEEFPAFYSRHSGLPVDLCCDSPQEVADIWRAKRALDLTGGLLVAVPVPEEDEIPTAQIEPLIEQALADARAAGLRSAEVTPYLLRRIAELTGARSLRANLALLRNNAKVAAAIAVAL